MLIEMAFVNENYQGEKFFLGEMVYCEFNSYDTYYIIKSIDGDRSDCVYVGDVTLERELASFKPLGRAFYDSQGYELRVLDVGYLSALVEDSTGVIDTISKLELMFMQKKKEGA